MNRGINDIGGKVTAGIVDTGGKFNSDVIATGVTKINVDLGKDMTAVINDTGSNFNACFRNMVDFPAVSLTRWCTLNSE